MKKHVIVMMLLLLLIGLANNAQASRAYHGNGDYEYEAHKDDDMELRWQLGYENWRRQCNKSEEQLETPAISTRIAGGDLAQPGMLPYQVGLLVQLSSGIGIQCGGSLISLQFVVTAAHCLYRALSAKVYLGNTRYADASEAAQVFNVTPKDFRIYEGYLGFGGYHDIAMIKLPTPAVLNERVQLISLAREFMQQQLLEEQPVSTSGWGSLGDGDESAAEGDLLHYVDVKVLSQQTCICAFLPGLVSTKRHICSNGAGGRGACEGDSGGPLVYQWRNASYLIGVTTFGSEGGCEINAPTVYTRVTAYLSWIEGHIKGVPKYG